MGVCKRGDTWRLSYFRNGKRIRQAIGPDKKKAEAEYEAMRTDIRGGRLHGNGDPRPFSACHKTAAIEGGDEKGLQAQSLQSLELAGAEGGICLRRSNVVFERLRPPRKADAAVRGGFSSLIAQRLARVQLPGPAMVAG